MLQGQMSIEDFMEPKIKPKFNIGQRIYKVVLDIVETGKITEMWDCDAQYGYRADEDNIVFWDKDLYESIYTSKAEAETKADSLRNAYEVIRAKHMEIIEERNFIEVCDDSRILISATAKKLKGNMVYWNDWQTYRFLEKLESEKETENFYQSKLKEIEEGLKSKRLEVNIPAELKDMYLCQNEIWSEYEYTSRNGAVRRKNDL